MTEWPVTSQKIMYGLLAGECRLVAVYGLRTRQQRHECFASKFRGGRWLPPRWYPLARFGRYGRRFTPHEPAPALAAWQDQSAGAERRSPAPRL